VASLILAICGGLPFSLILAIVFGIMALSQLKTRPQRGRGLAIAGLSVSGAWIVAFAVAIMVAINSAGSSSGAGSPGSLPEPRVNGSPAQVALADLRLGDCVRDVTEGVSVTTLFVVSCGDPHEGEVVGLFDLPSGGYPGADAVDKQAGDGCADRLDAYAPGKKNLDVFYFSPLEEDWSAGDRSVICMAVRTPAATGSVRS
jgi:hypothetical protein